MPSDVKVAAAAADAPAMTSADADSLVGAKRTMVADGVGADGNADVELPPPKRVKVGNSVSEAASADVPQPPPVAPTPVVANGH